MRRALLLGLAAASWVSACDRWWPKHKPSAIAADATVAGLGSVTPTGSGLVASPSSGLTEPAPPDTGWWGPLPTYDCPGPPKTPDVVVKQGGAYAGIHWWDSNALGTGSGYTLVDLSLSNFTEGCDAGLGTPFEDVGDASFDGSFTISNRSPAEMVGIFDAIADDGVSAYCYAEYKPDDPDHDYLVVLHDSYSTSVDGAIDICISRFTPDRIAGTIYCEELDAYSDGVESVYVTFDLQRADSPYWRVHGDAPCSYYYYWSPPQDLAWSGVWP